MKTVHLHAGTGLRVLTCFVSELLEEYGKKLQFPIGSVGWGFRMPKNESLSSSIEDDRVRLVFDTRFIDNLSQGNETSMFIGEKFQIVFRPVEAAVSAALVVDIGNTRSFGLLLDDIDHVKSMNIHQLQICEYSRWTDTFNKTGVFASHVCLEHMQPVDCPTAPENKEKFGRPLSCVRTGAAATSLISKTGAFMQQLNGCIAQVSPKRFFWDHDPVRFKWRASCIAEKKCVAPEGLLYDAWLGERKITPESMPPSTLIGAMVVEIYSQAEMQLNGEGSGTGLTADGPRRIRHVAITYPPAWTKLEKSAYRTTIQRHLNAFCNERALAHPTLHLECDEASGTLLAYISNEAEKFGGSLADWITTIGTIDVEGNGRTRIAVLDIGGGTSDLVMADVCFFKDNFGIVQLQINRFYQDGVLVAGDEMLRKVAVEIALPAIAQAMCPDNEDLRKIFFNFIIAQPTQNEMLRIMRSRWAQQLWFPLALQVVQAWQYGKKIVLSPDLRYNLNVFCRDCLEVIKTEPSFQQSRPVFKGLGAEKENPNNGEIEKLLSTMKPNLGKIRKICEEVFHDAAIRFGVPIGLAGCDRVLLAGKTTDFVDVRNVLAHGIPLPKHKIISFENYRVAPRWLSSAGKEGTDVLGDVKMTTVIGAAVELCAKKGIPVFGNMNNLQIEDAHLFSDSQQYWGIVPAVAAIPTFLNKEAVFMPGDGVQKKLIPMNSHSLLFARRRTKLENMTAQIAYELRVKPTLSGLPNGVVEIERAVNSDGSVELLLVGVVSGTFETSGTPVSLRKEHLELRQMVARTRSSGSPKAPFKSRSIGEVFI